MSAQSSIAEGPSLGPVGSAIPSVVSVVAVAGSYDAQSRVPSALLRGTMTSMLRACSPSMRGVVPGSVRIDR